MTNINTMLKRAKKQLKQRINKPTKKHAAQPASCTYVGEKRDTAKGDAS